MLVLGPWLMDLMFGVGVRLRRGGLVLVVARHGAVPVGGDAEPGGAGARPGAAAACVCWVAAALAFVLFLLLAEFDDRVLQVELAFTGAADRPLRRSSPLYRRT